MRTLLTLAWSKWYVRTGLIVTAVLMILAHNLLGGALRGGIPLAMLWVEIGTHGNYEAMKNYLLLEQLVHLQDFLPFLFFWPGLAAVLCYIGYSLDIGCRWLRSRKPG